MVKMYSVLENVHGSVFYTIYIPVMQTWNGFDLFFQKFVGMSYKIIVPGHYSFLSEFWVEVA
jgi:hypothetical protein